MPVAQVTGRAVFTIVGIIYLLWAVTSLLGERAPLDRTITRLYAVLIIAFFLSIPYATDPMHALREWFRFLAHSSVFWITVFTLCRKSDGVAQLMKGFGFGGLALLAALYLRWIIDAQYSNFQPSQRMLEDNLPFLTPFLLHFMRNWLPMKYRTGSTIAVVSLVLIYIIFSQGRAALLGLLVALLAYTTLVLHWRLRMGVAAALLLLAVSVSFDSQRFIRGADLSGSFTEIVDQFTNQRTQIWRHALSAHPRNVMVGVGIGNVNREQLVLSLKVGRENKVVMAKHLHNFLFDAWYETGIIGLLALLFWLATAFRRGFDTWRLKKQPYCAQA
ncbi:MAG: O-antigen ligase family protein, partial [Nitrososphaera sp.]